MSKRDLWREGEVRVISVTPVSSGVVRPVLLTATTIALIVVASSRYSFVADLKNWLFLIVAAPMAIVALTRLWQWRSHKVHVTNERIILEGGVLRHQRSGVEMRDVLGVRVDQRMSERLTRRGFVALDTIGGPVALGLVRHPAALRRLIDAERAQDPRNGVPFDTVYAVDEPEFFPREIRPDLWQRRQYD
jgi:membrane protein YdbS with pleckstrin-like domain